MIIEVGLILTNANPTSASLVKTPYMYGTRLEIFWLLLHLLAQALILEGPEKLFMYS